MMRRTLLGALIAVLMVPALAVASEGGEGAFSLGDFAFKIFNIVVLVGVLVYLLRPMIGQFLRERKEGIKKRLETAERERDEARKALVEIEERIGRTKEQIDEIAAQASREGEQIKEEIEAHTRAEIEQIQQQTARFVEEKINEIKRELKAYGARLSVEEAEALLRQRLSSAERALLFEQSLSRLSEKGKGGEA